MLLFIFISFPDFFRFCLFFRIVGVGGTTPPFDWQTEEAAGGHVSTQNRLKLKTRFLDIQLGIGRRCFVMGDGLGVGVPMEPTHCQMTAVAADLYLPLPKTQLPDQPTAIKGKSKCAEPGSRDSTIYFKHAAKINLLIAPVSGDEEVLPPPTQLFTVSLHHPSPNRPKPPKPPETLDLSVPCSFIHSKKKD